VTEETGEIKAAIESSEKNILESIEGGRKQLDDLHETIKPQLRGINWLIAAFRRLGSARNGPDDIGPPPAK
jgi:hypothetical protein